MQVLSTDKYVPSVIIAIISPQILSLYPGISIVAGPDLEIDLYPIFVPSSI